jgi:uncharacterized protein YfaS (alpha-2-macroglobulin family)
METFTYGDSAYFPFINEFYTLSTDTWKATDADATYPKITIIDPDSTTKVDAATMTKKATGKYEYSYIIPVTPVLGTWTGYIDTMNEGYPDRKYFSLTIK